MASQISNLPDTIMLLMRVPMAVIITLFIMTITIVTILLNPKPSSSSWPHLFHVFGFCYQSRLQEIKRRKRQKARELKAAAAEAMRVLFGRSQ